MIERRLAERLTQMRKNSGEPDKVLAHKSGYSESYIHRVCSGQKPNPSVAFVETMAEVYNVSPAWLVGWSES